jgi:hypothetical protein
MTLPRWRGACPGCAAVAHNGGESFKHARHRQCAGPARPSVAQQQPGQCVVELPEVNFSDYGDIRYLHLGTPWVQGSMLLDAPYDIDLEYVQRMMAWLLFVEPSSVAKRHAMQLGLGAASLTKFCHKKLRMKTTAIELNPQVVAACRVWFKLPADDARLSVVLGRCSRSGSPRPLARPDRRAAGGPVRPRSRRAGAGQRGLLCRLPQAC